jgi:predicted kinase
MARHTCTVPVPGSYSATHVPGSYSATHVLKVFPSASESKPVRWRGWAPNSSGPQHWPHSCTLTPRRNQMEGLPIPRSDSGGSVELCRSLSELARIEARLAREAARQEDAVSTQLSLELAATRKAIDSIDAVPRGPDANERCNTAAQQPGRNQLSLHVIVLVGTPGCGKSTFCAELDRRLATMGVPPPVRVSQDDLGSRGACQHLASTSLRKGRSVVIDRCNFDIPQRLHWLKIARAAGSGVPCVAVFLNTPIEICKQRVMQRKSHPTLNPSAESMRIVERFRQLLKPPTLSEGFAQVVEATEMPASVAEAAATVTRCISGRVSPLVAGAGAVSNGASNGAAADSRMSANASAWIPEGRDRYAQVDRQRPVDSLRQAARDATTEPKPEKEGQTGRASRGGVGAGAARPSAFAALMVRPPAQQVAVRFR